MMKLTAAILLLSCLLMNGLKGTAQTVTLSVKNVKLLTVLKEFKKQTGYTFFYNESVLTNAPDVHLELKKTPLKAALEACFRQQSDLMFKVIGASVVVSKKTDSALSNETKPAVGTRPMNEALGTVFNNRYEALVNATVIVVGTQKGTSTKSDGTFKLDNLQPDDKLRVSYIGYRSVDISLEDNPQLIIVLEETTELLDQVVAQGYSKTTRRLSTSTVSKITSEEIARQPVMNPLLALQGKVPGLSVAPLGAYAAAPVAMEVRGRGLLSNASGRPLIVVDGTPLNVGSNLGTMMGDGPVIGMLAYFSPANSQSSLFGFNPKDIESIEILKDIGATAIYGSAGANGVVLITTKRGKPGGLQVDVSVNAGVSRITRFWEMLNTPEYLQMRREAFRNDGITPNAQNAPDLFVWDTTRYTDWQKEIWGNTGRTMGTAVSVSGGSAQFAHRLAANYNHSDDISKLSGGSDAMGVSIALDTKSDNRKFEASLTANYNYTTADMIRFPLISRLAPNAPALFDKEGNLNFQEWNAATMEVGSIGLEELRKPTKSQTNSLFSNLRLSYQIAQGLNVVVSLGYNTSLNNINYLTPIVAQNPIYMPTGTAMYGKSSIHTWTAEPQVNYDTRIFGNGKLNLVAGATIKQERKENFTAIGLGYENDALLRSISNATFVQSSNIATPYKYAGLLGRLEYVWDNKYVLELRGRRDGSSRFGSGSRFGNFGSVGLAWVASDEPWLKKALEPVVNFLKFNTNVGTAGEDGGADYQYLSQWGKNYGQANYDGVSPLLNQHAVNPYYQWQLTKEFNLGMDAYFFNNNRLKLGINYYRKQVGNQLIFNPTPIFTGFGEVFGNRNAKVENQGWELTLQGDIIQQKKFTWSAFFNTAINQNKLLSYPDIEFTPYYSAMLEGRSLSDLYLLNYLGVDPQSGLYQFQDYNKDGRLSMDVSSAPLSGLNDFQHVMDLAPRFAGGMGHNFSYGSFGLSLFFDYKIQKGRNAFNTIDDPGRMANIPLEVFRNHWQAPGDNALYAKFTTNGIQSYAGQSSTLAYTDASFIRLNNIAFGYQFPETIIRKMKMKSCSFNISAHNLFLITRYKGIDPEMQEFGAMPPAKTIVAGFSFTF